MNRAFGINRLTIGLALGLILGIVLGAFLVSHFTSTPTETPVEVQRTVERVQLGDPDYEPPDQLPEMLAMNQLFRGVAQRTTPAVVFVEVTLPAGRADVPRDENHNFDEDLLRRFYRQRPYRQSAGSGVIVSRDGYIVTNYHVIADAERISVLLSDKREYDAVLVGSDPSTDLAVIRIEDGDHLPVIPLGNSDIVEVGDWVMAVGNPFRLTSTVTAGIVSALGRQVDIIEDDFRIEDFIQTDAAINPGNSGGALVNLQGELIGISTAIATRGGSYEGYGFAVPSNLVVRVVRDLIEYGTVQRGYLGIQITPISSRQANDLGLERVGGVLLSHVAQGGAAQRAGLRSGDVLLSIDGDEVNAPNQVQSRIALKRPGDHLSLDVWRNGRVATFEAELIGRDDAAIQRWAATLGRQPGEPERGLREEREPAPEVGMFDLEDWGIGLRDLSGRERSDFQVQNGAYVLYIRGGSPAAVDGLPRDVVITGIDGVAVNSANRVADMLSRIGTADESVLFEVKRRDGITAFYDISMPRPDPQ